MPLPASFAGQTEPAWLSVAKTGTVGGLGEREGATQQPKRIFGYEMRFQHDLPHDAESIIKKIF